MIVIKKTKEGPEIMIITPMGAKARELLEKLREKGLDFHARPVFCG